jgi:phytoene synthase
MTVAARKTAVDPELLAKSRAYCRVLTKHAAKNFYYGLKLLPEPKRSAMYALYAYMRLVDDIADDETNRTAEQRQRDLQQWQDCTHAALAGEPSKGHILWPAFAELVQRYQIPAKLFDEMIDGQRQDMAAGASGAPCAVATFTELRAYCYRVASVVGLASLHVWGVEQGTVAEVEAMGIDRGIAFQLTNVLRDLREDAARGRCYLPQEDLARFGVTAAEIAVGQPGSGFAELMRFQIERAEGFYQSSAALEARVRVDSRPTLVAMTEIYHGLLRKIAERPERVLRERVRLSTWEKLRIGWKAMRGR